MAFSTKAQWCVFWVVATAAVGSTIPAGMKSTFGDTIAIVDLFETSIQHITTLLPLLVLYCKYLCCHANTSTMMSHHLLFNFALWLTANLSHTANGFFVERPMVVITSRYHSLSHAHRLYAEADENNSNDDNSSSSPSSTRLKPLYDGTNYTFPDTTTPTGIAELLEVSFVKACMQLASGYVDILKMFIAASVAGYEYGFPLATLQEELAKCERQTANRPLLPEEERLRFQWLCIVYMTCEALQHPTKSAGATLSQHESQIGDIRDEYEPFLQLVASAYRSEDPIPSVEGLLTSHSNAPLSNPLETAILLQSLRVATLTPVVIQESKDAAGDTTTSIDPPKPPIKGAFD